MCITTKLEVHFHCLKNFKVKKRIEPLYQKGCEQNFQSKWKKWLNFVHFKQAWTEKKLLTQGVNRILLSQIWTLSVQCLNWNYYKIICRWINSKTIQQEKLEQDWAPQWPEQRVRAPGWDVLLVVEERFWVWISRISNPWNGSAQTSCQSTITTEKCSSWIILMKKRSG